MADRVRIALGAAALAALALSVSPALADRASDAYNQQLAAYQKAAAVKFRDDPTDVSGKAYEFAKATLDWFGVPGEALDAADLARSIKNEGVGAHNVGTFVAKVLANNVHAPQFKAAVEKMKQNELIEIAERLHLDTAGDLQKSVLEYLTETAPNAIAAGQDGSASEAATTVFLDVMSKLCKTCGVAYRGYELAAEAKQALEIAFDNTKTQTMFAEMAKSGWYRYDEFQQYFTGNDALKDEARKALTAMRESAGLAAPSDDDVMRFIYNRYERWQTEIKDRGDDAAILADVRDEYTKLLDYEKRDMFGDGSETQWASAYMNNFMGIYRDLVSYRGDAVWPAGARNGHATVEAAAADLLTRKLRDGISDAQYQYEKRKLLASWGWLSPDKVGNPPPPLPPKDDRATIVNRLQDRLPKLDQSKMSALFDRVGIKPSADFYNCMCPGSHGFHYYNGPDAGGPCRRIGPLGGVSWVGFDGGSMKKCADMYRLEDGRSVFDALANSISDLQAAQGRK